MVRVTEDGSRTFPLVCVREKAWVIKTIKSVLDTIASHREDEVGSESSKRPAIICKRHCACFILLTVSKDRVCCS